jgi:RNA polymerase sigma factor (sigma-70 family)
MASDQLNCIVRHVRRVVLLGDGGSLTDGQLLERFLSANEEAAFEALVRRHGPMVLGVCRRLLHHRQDAEDAFQATFLVLARRAATIEPREKVGNWLYGVAYRTALKARTVVARRRARERPFQDVAAPAGEESMDRLDWQPLLDRELNRLPEKHRVLIVLCDLEGRSRAEAAQQLGLPEGTVSSRLARARRRLARSLTRQGVSLSAGSLAVLLARQAAKAVAPGLRTTTVEAALQFATRTVVTGGVIAAPVAILAEGVLKTMFFTKLQMIVVGLLAAGLLGLGGSYLGHAARADKPAAVQASDAQAAQKPKPAVGPQFPATVKAVNADKGTVTVLMLIEPGKKGTTEKTYSLAKDAQIILTDARTKNDPGQAGKLTDLAEGWPVTVQLSPDQRAVQRIVVGPTNLAGMVKGVNAASHTLTLNFKNNKGQQEETFTVPEGTKVLLNDGLTKGAKDKEEDLSSLAEGTPVLLRISALDHKKVLAIRVQHHGLEGTVKGVDLGNQTLTITVKENAQIVDKVLRVAKNARLDAKLSDLSVGMPVRVTLSVFDSAAAVGIHLPPKED